jgi:hypothetical protein
MLHSPGDVRSRQRRCPVHRQPRAQEVTSTTSYGHAVRGISVDDHVQLGVGRTADVQGQAALSESSSGLPHETGRVLDRRTLRVGRLRGPQRAEWHDDRRLEVPEVEPVALGKIEHKRRTAVIHGRPPSCGCRYASRSQPSRSQLTSKLFEDVVRTPCLRSRERKAPLLLHRGGREVLVAKVMVGFGPCMLEERLHL